MRCLSERAYFIWDAEIEKLASFPRRNDSKVSRGGFCAGRTLWPLKASRCPTMHSLSRALETAVYMTSLRAQHNPG
eukprot:3769800-Pleurochrysis_carterae.AAC.1